MIGVFKVCLHICNKKINSIKEKFIKDLGKGFSEIGFVAVKGHLLNDKVKDSLYKEVKQFFNLPDSVKSKYIDINIQ